MCLRSLRKCLAINGFSPRTFSLSFIGIGIFIIIACIFDWKWMTRIVSPAKLSGIRAFIEELHGVEVRYKFKRFIIFVCGILLLFIGVLYWFYS